MSRQSMPASGKIEASYSPGEIGRHNKLFFAGPTMRHGADGGNAGRADFSGINLTGYGNRSRTDVAFHG